MGSNDWAIFLPIMAENSPPMGPLMEMLWLMRLPPPLGAISHWKWKRVPGIAIRTTFITGFPGETEEDFEELLAFVRKVEFDRVGVFTYSDEEGTPAFELPNKVDARVALRRRARLMKEQARISRRRNRARVGSTVRVLFEGASAESDLLWQGRMETQAADIDGSVLINDAPDDFEPLPGKFVNVLITEAHEYDLVGQIV